MEREHTSGREKLERRQRSGGQVEERTEARKKQVGMREVRRVQVREGLDGKERENMTRPQREKQQTTERRDRKE